MTTTDQLAAIEARADDPFGTSMQGIGQVDADRDALLAMVREQRAVIERVEALAEKWRYKGEFGWGAWQEGHGPDPEGFVLDHVSSEIRTALTATEGA
jgi:hypothetical protein